MILTACVIGDGAMGTLCAALLARNGLTVRLWGRDAERMSSLQATRCNSQYLPQLPIPPAVHFTSNAATACAGAGLVVAAVPCQFLRGVLALHANAVEQDAVVVSVVKGIETGSLRLASEIISEVLEGRSVVALSGPAIAGEIASGLPATVVCASRDGHAARLAQAAFSGPTFRVYTNDDLVGVELAGATKNVIALGAGILDGLGMGINCKASLVTRGLVEISRLGLALGARPETFSGLAGLGDLFTTCVSPTSRNRTAGERLGRGETLASVVASARGVVEGVETARSTLALAKRAGVEMPIVQAAHAVLFEGVCPRDAIRVLFSRDPKPEWA
mgnify:CR=1 FL=1